MRVFWLNGGIYLEPENEVEGEALLVLTRGWKMVLPVEHDGHDAPRSDGASGSCDGKDITL